MLDQRERQSQARHHPEVEPAHRLRQNAERSAGGITAAARGVVSACVHPPRVATG